MGDKMTPERARQWVVALRHDAKRRAEHPQESKKYALPFDKDAAALTHALAALDAVARVQAMLAETDTPETYRSPEGFTHSTNAAYRFGYAQAREAIRRALDGEADHGR